MRIRYGSLSGPCRFFFFAAVLSSVWLSFDQKSLVGEGLVNFRFQIIVCAIIGAFGWRRYFLISLLTSALLVMLQWHEIEVVRSYFASELKPYRADDASKRHYKLLSANILGKTNSTESISKLVEAEDSDIVILQEFNQRFTDLPILKSYPYKIEKLRDDDFGIAIFSRFELIDRRKSFRQRLQLNLNVQVATPDGFLEMIAVHLVPPGSSREKRFRDHQLEELISYVNEIKTPVMLAGDFNLTPFAPKYHNFVSRLGLSDVRARLGFQPSWPAFIPILWIPIDHVFFGKGLSISEVRRGPFIWSDHFPVVTEFFFSE